jgi:hypothetical protein
MQYSMPYTIYVTGYQIKLLRGPEHTCLKTYRARIRVRYGVLSGCNIRLRTCGPFGFGKIRAFRVRKESQVVGSVLPLI